ncbi:MAG: chromosomal replication initiator DnaA [Pseudomonadota bacterium]
MARQLAFDLPVRESRSRGDFFVSDANALALTRLDDATLWPNHKLVLVGPEGAGKTHLAHVWADATGALLLTPDVLEALDVPGTDCAVALDTADILTANQEEAVFHLHNHLSANALAFLLVARTPPAQWKLTLPDLKSRMVAADTVRIEAPDDALLSAVMVKQFADRQLAVAPNVIAWLVDHMDRSFASAQRMVDALDKAALAEGRAVTRPLAQKVAAALAHE